VARRTVAWLVILAGAAWGLASYLVLWGYTPIVVTERFVESLPGLLLLLPARAVLESIHFVEQRIVHHPFDFSSHNGWIGYVSAMTGAAILAVCWSVLSAPARVRAHRRRQDHLAEAQPADEASPATDVAP
jgi:hypothetical protein